MKPMFGAVLGVLALASGPVFAQSYEVPWWTVDGGGAMGTLGGTYAVSGTSGQPDAGGPFTGGAYAAVGGFWSLTAAGGGPQADLAVTKTDGQASAIPGQPVTYTIVATNSGPDPASSATVADTLPSALVGASWTCVGTAGGACTASGSGNIADTVDLPVAATVTYTLMATIDPAATGTLANTATVTVPAGVTDPDPSDDSATDTDTLMPQADLELLNSDSRDPIRAGDPLRYTVQVTNLGPSTSTGMTVVDEMSSGQYLVSVTPGSPVCVVAGMVITCNLGGLLPAALHTVMIDVAVSPGTLGTIFNMAGVTGNEADPVPANNSDTELTTVGLGIESELVPGSSMWADLASVFGDPDEDLFRISQKPYSSYEVVVDGTSGDIGSQGPLLERLDSDATNILQSSVAAGAGGSRSLRWENDTGAGLDNQYVRVRSAGCTGTCGPEDVYRIQAWDTTLLVPRFNNSATQVTVLVLQNTTDATVAGHARFWSNAGVLVGTQAFGMGPRGAFVVNTSAIPGASGMGGTITVSHDGSYGTLVGKAVAVEPATGFTFDTALLPRVR
jgi:uncharacterized repeat protein (TIGR01451 family)